MRMNNCKTKKILDLVESTNAKYVDFKFADKFEYHVNYVAWTKYIKEHYLGRKYVLVGNNNILRIGFVDRYPDLSYDEIVSYLNDIEW